MDYDFLEKFASRLGMQIPWRDSEHYHRWICLMEWAFKQMMDDASSAVSIILDDAARLSRKARDHD